MHRRSIARASLLWALAVGLGLQGCRRGEGEEAVEDAPAVSEAQAPELEPRPPSPARSLVEQLDLVPPNADGYLAVRDLRPLMEQARMLERVLAGPLRAAIPALASLGGGTGEARLAQLEQLEQLLGLGLAALEGAGVELDAGLVVAFSKPGPVVVFAAEELERLLTLASMFDAKLDLRRSCKSVPSRPGWYVCSLAGPELAERYAPAGKGQALRERLAETFCAEDLDAANLALSLADRERPLDLLLETQADLWELSVPLPPALAGAELLRPTVPRSLDRLVPGTSFTWAQLDPALAARALDLDELAPGTAAGRLAELLTGELWFGAHDDPDGMLLRVGVEDAAAASEGVEAMAKLLPEGALTPAELPELELEFDRARLELGGGSTPSIGARATGARAEGWSASLGLDPRARLWVGGDHLNLALGEVQAIPKALERPPAALASAARGELPSTLARRLAAGEVGFALYLVLDHWQAPLRQAELDALLMGIGGAPGVDVRGLSSLFEALAPWSSLALWLARPRADADAWLVKLTLVPFASSGDPEEARAAREALDALLAGAEAAPLYRELGARFPRSRRASSYRARLGEAPQHHGAAGMTQLALIGALTMPLIEAQLATPQRSEAPAMTQSILVAALRAREQAGSCAGFIGRAGPTPPLALRCDEGPKGRCQPRDDRAPDAPLEQGRYSLTSWTEDPLWRAINYKPRAGVGHRAHYSIEVEVRGGTCNILVEAQNDRVEDPEEAREPQIHRRRATVAKDGSTTLSALEIEGPG